MKPGLPSVSYLTTSHPESIGAYIDQIPKSFKSRKLFKELEERGISDITLRIWLLSSPDADLKERLLMALLGESVEEAHKALRRWSCDYEPGNLPFVRLFLSGSVPRKLAVGCSLSNPCYRVVA